MTIRFILLGVYLIMTLFVSTLVLGASSNATDYRALGSFAVETRLENWTDPARERTLPVSIMSISLENKMKSQSSRKGRGRWSSWGRPCFFAI